VTDGERLIYAEYLDAFAIVRSGIGLDHVAAASVEARVARALGASDGADEEFMPSPRWLLLSTVDRLINSEEKPDDAKACKVVPMKDEEKP